MPVPCPDMEKQRRQNILNASAAVEGEHFNLGKKISTPQDVMMEELKLRSNRGSRMFQERLKRVERFTLENINTEACGGKNGPYSDKENSSNSQVGISQPDKDALVSTLTHTVAQKGNPSILAPGYSGPLAEVPHERFNVTVIPKSYCSPWQKGRRDGDNVVASISANLPDPPFKLTPASYKCFNRAPTPFGGTAGSTRTFPLPWFELNQAYTEANMTWARMCDRPNFNRTPRGWIAQCTAETVEL